MGLRLDQSLTQLLDGRRASIRRRDAVAVGKGEDAPLPLT
jgi:hypothetical protein